MTVRCVTYLFVELNEGWLEECSVILNHVIWVLGMTQTFAHFIFWLQKVFLDLSRKGVKRNNDVSGISNLFQLDVGNFLVAHVGWIVGWNESWEFWYVGLIL